MGKKQFTTTRGERLSYGLYAFGAILSYYVIMSFLQLFMTDLGIPAATVGLIFVFAKVWDAVNDPIFGVMVDKVNFKNGKYKPWLKLAGFVIPLTTIFLCHPEPRFRLRSSGQQRHIFYGIQHILCTMFR